MMTRRHFLSGAAALSGLILTSRYSSPVFAQINYDKNPFSLGVASGDPLPDGIVLWTRLAPHPLQGGGMPPGDVPVRWHIASDEGMKNIVQQGTATASAALGHSVHVEVMGLQPARTYWYQFETGGVLSPVGRTRTAPALNASPEKLRFAFASCQSWTNGYYAAYRHMAQEDLDFVLHLGDYIYEGKIGNQTARAFDVPSPVRDEPLTLEQYRLRYSLYKLDPDLQAAHRAFPFIVTWDDHEVDNNYAAYIDQDNSDPKIFLRRRAAAYQAHYEHMPLRRSALPKGPDMMLYRRFTFGDLAQLNVLDTRQYRSDQVKGNSAPKRSRASLRASRTMLGRNQREWLLQGLNGSSSRWNVMAQQVIMAQFIRTAGGKETFNMDGWDGYPTERQRFMNYLAARKLRNPIVLAGDSHTNLVSDLKADFAKAESPIVGSEFAGTAISSGGMTPEAQQSRRQDVARQPHLKWFEGTKRGYVSCTLDRKLWRSDFLQVADVKKQDSPVTVGASWIVEDGKAGVQRDL
jgi:alkaline phosphatase D